MNATRLGYGFALTWYYGIAAVKRYWWVVVLAAGFIYPWIQLYRSHI